MHANEGPSHVSQPTAIAGAFVSAFETIFCAPDHRLSSLILARKPPLTLLHKVLSITPKHSMHFPSKRVALPSLFSQSFDAA